MESKNSTYRIYYVCYTITMHGIVMAIHLITYVCACEHGRRFACVLATAYSLCHMKVSINLLKIWHIIVRLLVTDVAIVRGIHRACVSADCHTTTAMWVSSMFSNRKGYRHHRRRAQHMKWWHMCAVEWTELDSIRQNSRASERTSERSISNER